MNDLDLLALAVLRTGTESAWNAFLDECEERGEWAKAASVWFARDRSPDPDYVRKLIRDKNGQKGMWSITTAASMAWARRVRDMLHECHHHNSPDKLPECGTLVTSK